MLIGFLVFCFFTFRLNLKLRKCYKNLYSWVFKEKSCIFVYFLALLGRTQAYLIFLILQEAPAIIKNNKIKLKCKVKTQIKENN